MPTIWHTSANPLHKKSHFSLIFNGNRDVDKAEVKFLLIFIIHFNGYEIMMMTWQDYKHREWIHVVVSSFFLGRSWLSSFLLLLDVNGKILYCFFLFVAGWLWNYHCYCYEEEWLSSRKFSLTFLSFNGVFLLKLYDKKSLWIKRVFFWWF